MQDNLKKVIEHYKQAVEDPHKGMFLSSCFINELVKGDKNCNRCIYRQKAYYTCGLYHSIR